ncbi:MAG TPA: GTP cyclohydrolase I FolE [Candidatus Binataceae bacterium]|nr:GTP cyclohydrolase I FolE [Candidatus Binataceae bacterium]
MNRVATNGHAKPSASASREKLEREKVEEAVRTILRFMGEDPDREGLERTPQRVTKAFEYFSAGYRKDPKEAINGALFTEEDYQEMILCKDLDFYSLCEHHLLPFMGKAHVAYLPNRKIVGLSKLARMVEIFARRLQVQERMTTQIARTLMDEIDPLGVAVVLEAEHMCMRMRGVEKQNSFVTTSAMLGVFRTNVETRHEFINLLRQGHR